LFSGFHTVGRQGAGGPAHGLCGGCFFRGAPGFLFGEWFVRGGPFFRGWGLRTGRGGTAGCLGNLAGERGGGPTHGIVKKKKGGATPPGWAWGRGGGKGGPQHGPTGALGWGAWEVFRGGGVGGGERHKKRPRAFSSKRGGGFDWGGGNLLDPPPGFFSFWERDWEKAPEWFGETNVLLD